MSNDDIGPSSPHHYCSVQEDRVLAGGWSVSALESAGVLCTVQVSSWSLCVTIRDNTPSGHQSQVGCKCLHTASSHCSLLLYPAISGEAPPRCVPSWSRQQWCEAAPDLQPTVPPSLSTPMSALHRWRGRGWSTPGLTSDCPLQLDTVRSLISQSSLRTLV